MRRRGRKEEKLEPVRYAPIQSRRLPGQSKRDPHEENDDDFVSHAERYRHRETKTASWVKSMPLRLQMFMQQSGNEVSMRIFRDVVIRFPVVNWSKEEVLALTQPYGECEYISGPNENKKNGDSIQVEKDFTHVIRFEEGTDAIRCYFALNGARIDPDEHRMMVEGVVDAMRSSNADGDSADVDIDFPLMQCADPTKQIFITMDFFRLAFYIGEPERPSGGKPKPRPEKKKFSIPSIPSRASLCTLGGQNQMPNFAALSSQLREEALHMDDVFPLVLSHNVEWEEFCFLVNFLSFLHNQYLPTYIGEESPAFDTARQAAKVVEPTIPDPVPSLSLAGAIRTVFYGLRHTNWDAARVMQWIDAVTDHGERALIEGRTAFPVGKGKRWLNLEHVKWMVVMICLVGVFLTILKYLL
jgi:hypothetical protein